MINFPKTEELARDVYVTAPIQTKWDGKEYDLSNTVRVPYGLVYHWKQAFPDVEFEVSDVPQKETAARDIINPLEDNERGEAFAGLKKVRKPKEE